MRLRTTLTLILTAALGLAVAWWGWPRIQLQRALSGITSDDIDRRTASWSYLGQTIDQSRRTRALSALEAINERLSTAPDAALWQGADWLRARGQWSWDLQPWDLVIHDLVVRSSSDAPDELQLAADTMTRAPQELPWDGFKQAVGPALQASDPSTRRLAFDALCGWAGPEGGDLISQLPFPKEDLPLRRDRLLTLSWCDHDDNIRITASTGSDEEVGLLEASLLLQLRNEPESLDKLDDPPAEVAWASILRYISGPTATSRLKRLERDGDATARRVLQLRSVNDEQRQSRRVALDPSQDPSLRKMAAWRWNGAEPKLVRELTDLLPAEEDGSVYASALLAERVLERSDAIELAEQWIRDFNDDRKRAGALLAALLGEHHQLLLQAYDLEDVPQVKTTQRLALHAMGHPLPGADPIEFAYRTMHRAGGDFDPDVVMCLLIGGHADAIGQLVSSPRPPWRLSTQQRTWLIQRFLPQWHQRCGRPVGGDVRGLSLHFDLLRALHRLTHRRLEFDPAVREFR